MELPLISIIIPNFNRETFIAETLESLLNQSYSNWEAIIVDDGSTDKSEDVVLEYCRKDERFTFITRDRLPKGAPTCRNIGVENSKGEYLIFLDSDDILAPYCLEKRVEQISKYPGYDFLVFPMLVFSKKPGDSAVLWNSYKGDDALTEFIGLNTPWQTSGPLWKKSAVLKLNGWDEDVMSWQDWEFHIRAIVNGASFKMIDDLPDCFLRRDDHDRISAKDFQLKQFEAKINLFEKVYKLLLNKNKLSPLYKKAFAFHFFNHALIAARYWPKRGLSLSCMHRLKQQNLVSHKVFLLLNTYVKSVAYMRYLNSKRIDLFLYKSGYWLVAKYFFRGQISYTKGAVLPESEFISVKKIISKQYA